jgi:hypothetical protein
MLVIEAVICPLALPGIQYNSARAMFYTKSGNYSEQHPEFPRRVSFFFNFEILCTALEKAKILLSQEEQH